MKIMPGHYDVLKKLIAEKVSKAGYTFAEIRAFYHDNEIGKNHSMRARWDIYNASVPSGLAKELYVYLNDDHIDTALKHITGIL